MAGDYKRYWRSGRFAAHCWRGWIRWLSEPAPLPAAVGSRGPADPVDPNDDIRRGHVACVPRSPARHCATTSPATTWCAGFDR